MNKPNFIIIEGIDGIGKTTVVEGVISKLDNFITYKETKDSEIGKNIKNLKIHSPLLDILTFSLVREELLLSTAIPNLEKGNSIILDRFILSTYVYQYFRYSKDQREKEILDLIKITENKFIDTIEKITHSPIKYIYLHTDYKNILGRIEGRNEKVDRFEENLPNIMNSYNEALKHVKGEIIKIDATESILTVRDSVLNTIKELC